jgi:4-amino-4-deoxy-L-arabinose transferase-like glycosyltransferase
MPGSTADASRTRRDGWMIGIAALAVRLGVVIWAAPRFPAVADGAYYHRVAERIAAGLGYTWLWPDGAVTYAAHYPVGYPAIVGAIYAITGPHPGAAMVLNAVLGALAALAVHRLTAAAGERRAAAVAGLLVAVHPGLVGYTPALMTEGATAALVTCAAWAAAGARRAAAPSSETAGDGGAEGPHGGRPRLRGAIGRTALAGVIIGAATLVRPQSIVLAPILAWIAWGSAARPKYAAVGAAVALCAALAVCAPWTLRNCVRMKSCALVSVNGGWNLLIGADRESTGSWAPIKVPEACREVWDEAAKDACFGQEARRFIAEQPGAWIALAPKKLAATFDYCGAAGWYLHASNSDAFSERAKIGLGVVETLYERVVLVLAVVGAARLRFAEPRRVRTAAGILALAAIGVVFALLVHAWVSYLALALLSLVPLGNGRREPFVASAAAAVIGATILTHAVFFGAGRYALIVFPLLCGAAGLGVAAAVEGRKRAQ